VLSTASVSASCHSSPGHDAARKEFTYEPEKAIDGLSDTAWRCDGDGVGQWLRIDFRRKVTLTSIGIIPGFAKTDPTDRTDRYAQNRRISAVRYTFDDGSTFQKTFDTSASVRSVQTIPLPGVSTSQVTITILSSEPEEVPFNQVAISEIVVSP
jgi:F5/8 type C domain